MAEARIRLQVEPGVNPFVPGASGAISGGQDSWAHQFPQWETWGVKTAHGNNVYDIYHPDGREHTKVRSIAVESTSFEEGMAVIVGFYRSDRSRPFILAFAGGMAPPYVGGGEAIEIAVWTHDRQGPGRTSRSVWERIQATRLRSISGSFQTPSLRVWTGSIYLWNFDDVSALKMGEHHDPWYEAGEYAMPTYHAPSYELGLGSALDMALDVAGDFCFLYSGGALKASREEFETTWASPIDPAGLS